MTRLFAAALVACAVAVSGCEGSPKPDPNGATAELPRDQRKCDFRNRQKEVDAILDKVNAGDPAGRRDRIAMHAAALMSAAQSAGKVIGGAQDEMSCRRTAIVAFSTLIESPAHEQDARTKRGEQIRLGLTACEVSTSSAANRSLCDFVRIYALTETADMAGREALKVSGGALGAEMLDSVRQQAERFRANVKDEWSKLPDAPVEVRDPILLRATCRMETALIDIQRGSSDPALVEKLTQIALVREDLVKNALPHLSFPPSSAETSACAASAASEGCLQARRNTLSSVCAREAGLRSQ